ncbi:ABC transporter ATP-binding protein [Streptococcus hillyeri]|uniref:ABC transporter ATP-binding protein n=1 Tax=Streptococcus hillyeri TaxID=2282420 RepID=A0A3L9DQ32_9STRE|nr:MULTISPECIES: ABC transporter ATP-binding protein [Streptococcus]RLY03576.1 ABC transporter ATP-binding protein [Streptococcus hillyeri]
MESVAIEVTHLSQTFELNKGKKLPILKDISFSSSYGEFISILGVSGSGKSTLLKAIASLLKPTSGEVYINGINPYKLNSNKLAAFRREEVSLIFQSYNLVPALPVFENIVLPLRLGHKPINRQEVINLLQQMNFEADINAKVENLSGGEQQKVAIARAILSNSRIILADEPTGALDSNSRQAIFELLRELTHQGKCVLMVTHDLELASYTDKSLILKDGLIAQIIETPSASELYQALEVGTTGK